MSHLSTRRMVSQALSGGLWKTSKQLEAETGVTRDRMISAGMLEDGTLLGCTRKGFKLTELATPEEVDAVVASLSSRRAAVQRRIDALQAI